MRASDVARTGENLTRIGSGITLILALTAALALPSPAAAQTVPPGHADVTVGAVEIAVFPGHGIGVTVDEIPTDGIADRVFVLQAHARIPPELPLAMRTARVIFQEDRLLVVSLEEPLAAGLFLYGVDEDAVAEQVRGQLGAGPAGEAPPQIFLHGGHGLAHHWGEFPLPIRSWPPEIEPMIELGDVTSQSECQAGGPGATSCSVTCGGTGHGCSISCGDGSYACCNCGFLVSTCSCVSSDTSSGGGGGGGGGGDDLCAGGGYCPPECMSCGSNSY